MVSPNILLTLYTSDSTGKKNYITASKHYLVTSEKHHIEGRAYLNDSVPLTKQQSRIDLFCLFCPLSDTHNLQG